MGDLPGCLTHKLRPGLESRLPINKLIFASSVLAAGCLSSEESQHILQVSAVTSLIHLYQWARDNRAEYQLCQHQELTLLSDLCQH